jgi:putative transposase
MVKKCLSRMSGKLSRTVLRRGKGSNPFSLVDYCSKAYQKMVTQNHIVSSMSRKGNCWDNAPMESFWGTLKQEWLNDQHFRTRDEAKTAVFEYIWIFYNRKRMHSSIGYMTPEKYYAARLVKELAA